MSSLFTSLPRQLYCHVDARFLSNGGRQTFEPCSWFGLTSVPGRAWGLSILLECGAMYSAVPPHALYFAVPGADRSAEPWALKDAQLWDTFGYEFAVGIYDQLDGRDVEAYVGADSQHLSGEYLFTAQHFGDGYSLTPEQAKQYHFLKLENGRLTCLPANRVLFHDLSFTNVTERPTWLRRQTAIYTCENAGAPSSNTKGSTKSATPDASAASTE